MTMQWRAVIVKIFMFCCLMSVGKGFFIKEIWNSAWCTNYYFAVLCVFHIFAAFYFDILFYPPFTVLPNFAQRVDVAVEALSSTPGKEVDENEFIDASHLVYDGVREIRMAVLMNKADDELDPDDVLIDDYHGIEIRSKCKFSLFIFECTYKSILPQREREYSSYM